VSERGDGFNISPMDDASVALVARTKEISGDLTAFIAMLGRIRGQHHHFRIAYTEQNGLAIYFDGGPWKGVPS